mmetsp:Transcript_3745/g.10618  ORF Transcript_3745/g.10618 Transcript_3745/m.10618 type:complete len:213 (+) Transcript_3745:773-1411(+)
MPTLRALKSCNPNHRAAAVTTTTTTMPPQQARLLRLPNRIRLPRRGTGEPFRPRVIWIAWVAPRLRRRRRRRRLPRLLPLVRRPKTRGSHPTARPIGACRMQAVTWNTSRRDHHLRRTRTDRPESPAAEAAEAAAAATFHPAEPLARARARATWSSCRGLRLLRPRTQTHPPPLRPNNRPPKAKRKKHNRVPNRPRTRIWKRCVMMDRWMDQ